MLRSILEFESDCDHRFFCGTPRGYVHTSPRGPKRLVIIAAKKWSVRHTVCQKYNHVWDDIGCNLLVFLIIRKFCNWIYLWRISCVVISQIPFLYTHFLKLRPVASRFIKKLFIFNIIILFLIILLLFYADELEILGFSMKSILFSSSFNVKIKISSN